MGAEREAAGVLTCFESLIRSGHVCLLYEDEQDRCAFATAFIRKGLERGQRCIYAAGDGGRAAAALLEREIDVESAAGSGALIIARPEELYRGPEAAVSFWQKALAAALASGYSGLTVSGEAGGILNTNFDFHSWLEYEGTVDAVFSRDNCLALCRYNLKQVSAEFALGAILTHPRVIYRGAVCHNFYYDGDAECNGAAHSRAPWAIEPARLADALGRLRYPERMLAGEGRRPAAADLAGVARKILGGDPAGVEDLYRTFYEGVRFLLGRRLPPGMASDSVRAVLAAAVRAIRRGNCDPEGLPQLVLSLVRQQIGPGQGREVQVRACASREVEDMRLALSRLPRAHREAAIRYYVLGEAERAICAALGLTEKEFSYVRSRLRAGFARNSLDRLRIS